MIVNTLYSLVKDSLAASDDEVFSKIAKLNAFNITCSDLSKLKCISKGDEKKVYISADKQYVYKVMLVPQNLASAIENFYLLNYIFKDRFEEDIVFIEKHKSSYVFLLSQQYYKPLHWSCFDLSVKEIRLQKLSIFKQVYEYMMKLGFKLDYAKSIYTLYEPISFTYSNSQYCISDIKIENLTLHDGKLFFYDMNISKN